MDEVALIRPISDPKEATKELLHAKPGTIVYHTNNETLVIKIRHRAAYSILT